MAALSINYNELRTKEAMIEISSPFLFKTFLNIDHFGVTLLTPICIFGRKPGNGTKNIIKTFPLLHLHQHRGI